jgi:predicted peroxiredoxin
MSEAPTSEMLTSEALSEGGHALNILLVSGGHGPAHAAFTLAAGAAALGRPVLVFAMGAGCRALLADVENEKQDALVRSRGVAGLAELRGAAVELGTRLVACEAALRGEGLDRAALLPGVEVAGVVTFLEAARGRDLVSL